MRINSEYLPAKASAWPTWGIGARVLAVHSRGAR